VTRAHLGEFGVVTPEACLRHAPKGIHNVERLIAACDRADRPAPARKALNLLADQLVDTQKKIEALTADIRADARANEAAQRLQTIPGVPPQAGHVQTWRTSGATGRSPQAHWPRLCPISRTSNQDGISPPGWV
jgi:transposase